MVDQPTSEIRTKLFGFLLFNRLNYNCCRTEGLCPKSKLVRILAFHCTVNIRNPNDRSFEIAVFGFRMFGSFERSDFRHRVKNRVNVRNPNVRTDLFGFRSILSVRTDLQPNDGVLSEIRTCSVFGRLLYFTILI